MHRTKFSLLGLLSAGALLAASGAACAQQVVAAPGFVLIIGPSDGIPAVAVQQPDPFQMIRQMDAQMDQMMAAAQANMQSLQNAALTPGAPGSGMSGVVVTTYSDGSGSCTQRIIYPGNGAPAKIDVSQTGNECAALHMGVPSALPSAPAQPAAPATIQVRNEAPAAPVMLADRGN